ncbi:MAG: hypothetical protein AVDCRST_MAG56-7462 [uncultured Cytophagales bacterium]|uniref:Uncharacterized protein n=1 Tax=uncultured Cytophagales bacterium TaxID=158755 RepID=A0A6J4LEW0_9SPHI|nr:MAG: hypothetical protein AVDCRST_MAG56-7462 [uncultured Cytophagales bacterium]
MPSAVQLFLCGLCAAEAPLRENPPKWSVFYYKRGTIRVQLAGAIKLKTFLLLIKP